MPLLILREKIAIRIQKLVRHRQYLHTKHQTTNDKYNAEFWPRQLQKPEELSKCLQKFEDQLKTCKSALDVQNLVIPQPIKSPFKSKLVINTVLWWAYFVTDIINKTRVCNKQTFNDQLNQTKSLNENKQLLCKSNCDNHNLQIQDLCPLLTISNHTSCIDDPLIWGMLVSPTHCWNNLEKIRWSPAALEVCFGKLWHSNFFALGKSFPIIRGAGLDQPAMNFAQSLLRCNQWIHFFPEGRVMRDKAGMPLDNQLDFGYKFKWGVSKLIMDFFSRKNNPGLPSETKFLRILPIYHCGIDSVLPIGWPYLPRIGKRISIYVRSSVIRLDQESLNQIIHSNSNEIPKQKSKKVDGTDQKVYTIKKYSDEETQRIKLTKYLETEMDKIIEPAEDFHRYN